MNRIINHISGHFMLIGVDGSGMTSLTKFSASICRHKLFRIDKTESYDLNSFNEDLKKMHDHSGPKGGTSCFYITEDDIKDEQFLDVINTFIAIGEIPGLFSEEEKEAIIPQTKNIYMKEVGFKGEDPSPETLWNFFL